jgi:hypothetical protein
MKSLSAPPQTPPTQQQANFEMLAAQDPQFATYMQIANDCMNRITHGTSNITPQQCELSLQQGADKWCGFAEYHVEKCDFASQVARAFKNFNSTTGGILGPGADVPPLTQLFPDLADDLPSTIIPPP